MPQRPRFGEGLFLWAMARPWWVLAVALLFSVLALFGIQRLRIEANFADSLPDDQPEVIELRHLQRVVGGASYVIVTIRPPSPELVPPFLDALAARLKDHPDVRYVDYRPPNDFLRRAALLFMPLAELREFAAQVERRLDQLKLKEFYVDFSGPEESAISLQALDAKYQFIKGHDWYRNDAGTLFVMLIKPTGRATDTAFTTRLLRDVRAAIAASREALGPAYAAPEFDVRLTGPYVKAMTQLARVVTDAKRVALVSFVSMVFVLTLYFRRKRVVAMLMLPLSMGILWAMGMAYLMFGALNFFTSVACAVLMGLADDLGIHFYSHYAEARRRSKAPLAALQHCYRELAMAMWLETVTTAAAFFALAFSDFKPLFQFGIIAGVGIFCTLLAMLYVFPALTLIFERIRPLQIEGSEPPRLARLAGAMFPVLTRRRTFVLLSLLVAACVVPVAMGRLRLDYNYSNIMGLQATKSLDQAVDEIFTYSVNPEVARAATPEDAKAFARSLRSARDARRAQGGRSTIQNALALADFVPDDQTEKMQLVARLRAAFTPTVLRLMTADERATYERLAPALAPTPITFQDLPAAILNKFEDLEGGFGRFLYIFPDFDRQDGRALRTFVREATEVACPDCRERVVVSGESIVFFHVVEQLLSEGRWVVVASLLMIWAALLVSFRRFRHAARCFLPMAVGMTALFGIMALCGIQFTIVNLAAIPILMGIGVDYAIYCYQHVRQHGWTNFRSVYRHVMPSILGSSLTTMCGFGALLAADNHGVFSFGLVAALGVGCCCLAALLWLPGLLEWQWREDDGEIVTSSELVIGESVPSVAEGRR
ncbi:MAG: MMPL family transporter [Deltaproteobacteria bacterium]|nr:MMPL family transporter [Deltaproteobacteria bacterium]